MKLQFAAMTLASLMVISSTSFAGTAPSPLFGTVNDPLWLSSDRLIVNVMTDSGSEYRTLGLSGASEVLVSAAANATELVQSPNGKQAAYVNDNGDLFLVDVSTKALTKLSTDNEPKMELQFNEAGTKLYFLYGEKIDKVGVIQLADGKMTNLISDGVAYKSDLQVSRDETRAVYAVTKAGKVDEVNEAYTVDSKGTEPQLFIAAFAPGSKAVQLTTAVDNKVFVKTLADNSVVYVSAHPDKDGLPLRKISPDGKEDRYFVSHLDVLGVSVLKDGSLVVIGQNSSYAKALFAVDNSGATKKLLNLPADATAVSGTDLNHLAITVDTESGEKVSVLNGGKLVDLSK